MAEALTGALDRAAQTLLAHDAVEDVKVHGILDGYMVLEADFRVSMPSAWLAAGRSPTGVLPVEPVTLRFPPSFPLRAPKISLRMDFDRSHPHINPGRVDQPPAPCLIEGTLGEFMQVAGFVGVVNQISEWLNHAAEGTLIRPEQGWEPVRRDDLRHWIAADAKRLQSMVDGKERSQFLPFTYTQWSVGSTKMVDGWLGDDKIQVSAKLAPKLFSRRETDKHFSLGRSLALVATPGKLPNGKMKEVGTYLPETVSTVAELRQRAEEFGCANALTDGLRHLSSSLVSGRLPDQLVPVPILLMVVRPYHLIGTDSLVELVPYLIMGTTRKLLPEGEATPVVPVGHLAALTPGLLRRLSGSDETGYPQPWTLFGAGSLGSHIALSMGKMGDGPASIVDKDILSPHNAARYGLVPTNLPSSLMSFKAVALREALADLRQLPSVVTEDILAILGDADRRSAAIPNKTWAVINTTGSLAVRDALMNAASKMDARVIEGGLHGNGAAAMLAVEGADHNPSIGDLVGVAYERARKDSRLKNALFPDRPAHQRWDIGQGCSSQTMALPDAVVSLFASSITLAIADFRRNGLPTDGGRLLLGLREGVQAGWSEVQVPPFRIVDAEDGKPWTIRIGAEVDQTIAAEVALHPRVETGGILMGRISEADCTFHITGLIPAPEDSIRGAAKFVLGKKGVKRAIAAYSMSAGGGLYCLGTWHSHLAPYGPSGMDRATAAIVEKGRIAPSVLLIHTPAGYRALVTGDS